MNKLKMFLYNLFPKRIKKILGRSKLLRPLRNAFFRTSGTFVEVAANIKRTYANYLVQFTFYGSIQAVNKAKKHGIENTLLNNSLALLTTTSNDKVVFDVGTNFGYLSLVWASSVSQQGRVYSFEPHPHLFKTYKKSVIANNLVDVIVPINKVVGNTLGNIEINYNTTTSNTLSQSENKKIVRKEIVEIVSLDYFIQTHNIKKCDLVKIDVDGIEFDILNGSIELIRKFKPIFIVEMNNDARIIDFFDQQEYTILNMKLLPIQLGELPSNVFCIPNQ